MANKIITRQFVHRWLSHKPCVRLLLLSARPLFTFPAVDHHRQYRIILLGDRRCVNNLPRAAMRSGTSRSQPTTCRSLRHSDAQTSTSVTPSDRCCYRSLYLLAPPHCAYTTIITTPQCQRQFIQRHTVCDKTRCRRDIRIRSIVPHSLAVHLRSYVSKNKKNLDKAFISLSDAHLPPAEPTGRWRPTHKLFVYIALLRCLLRCVVFQRVADAVSYGCRTPFWIQSHLHDTVFGNGV